jgi:hypothetical protein
MRAIVDILAITLAAIAVLACLEASKRARRSLDRNLMYAKAAAAFWFLLCQSSWVMSSLAGLTYAPIFTEYSWDVFNISVMATFMVSAWAKKLR